MLGILKAGGAYVPIDPAFPAERAAFIAEDCGARVVLASIRKRYAKGEKATEAAPQS